MKYKDENYYINKLKDYENKYIASSNCDEKRRFNNLLYALIYGVINLETSMTKDLTYKYICNDKLLYSIYCDLSHSQLKKQDDKSLLVNAINDMMQSLSTIQHIISKF